MEVCNEKKGGNDGILWKSWFAEIENLKFIAVTLSYLKLT